MNKIAIAIHGGASESSPFIEKNRPAIQDGLKEAIQAGYLVLEKGGSALDAVEEAVIFLENNPFFNAGLGSALNAAGKVEMDASIMDGKTLDAGAVSMVTQVKNPIILARKIMQKTKHVFLSGYGALTIAKQEGLALEDEDYFITEHQYKTFEKLRAQEQMSDILKKRTHGTVGAVALDSKGNLAAATSTGGTPNCLPGRIGDSCVIGAGCYANNASCAVSGTGEGEYLITRVIGHSIAVLSDKMTLQEACNAVIPGYQDDRGIGVIAVNPMGDIGIHYNTEIMKRAWIGLDRKMFVAI